MFVVGGFATFVDVAAVVICLRFNMQINIIGHTMLLNKYGQNIYDNSDYAAVSFVCSPILLCAFH